MSRTVIIKRTSLYPTITARMRNSAGAVISLADATSVSFSLRDTDTDEMVFTDRACTITDATQGTVEFAWEAGDTDNPGAFIGDFTINWASGATEIIPTKGYVHVRVLQAAADA